MLRRSSSRCGLAPLALALALASSAAHAQTERVDALIHEGVELRRSHRDLEALAVFRRAYDQSRGPRALAQMALAEQALGRWVEAEAHLLTALAATDPWIARSRATLEAALAVIGHHLGGLWIDGTVSGAEIYVEGQRVATLPMAGAARVVAGSVSVEVRAPGYESVTRLVTVPAGEEAREVVGLNRAAADPSRSRVASAMTTTPSATETTARPGGTARVLAWVSLGGAAVGVAAGVVALVIREGAVAQYNQDPACPGQRSSDQRGDCGTRIRTANDLYFVAPSAFVGGAALAVASVVLFATAPVGERREQAAWFACGVELGTPGVTCGGRF